MVRHLFFSLYVLVLAASFVHGQEALPVFRAYGSGDGLAGGTLHVTLIDSAGYLWTGAYTGLHRYDGYTFRNYLVNALDDCALKHVQVFDLAEQNRRYLWIGTSGGLYRLDRTTDCFELFPITTGEQRASLSVYSLQFAADGQLHIGTQHGHRSLDLTDPAQPVLTVISERVRVENFGLWQDQLWVAHGKYLEAVKAGKVISSVPFPSLVRCLMPLSPDTLLVGTNEGAWFYLRGQETPVRAYPQHADLKQVTIRGFHRGVDGRIYVATQGKGLSRFFP
ncbi:MAG: hypothetical protein AAFZ52_03105, partial [Bacteroidota bacterium]